MKRNLLIYNFGGYAIKFNKLKHQQSHLRKVLSGNNPISLPPTSASLIPSSFLAAKKYETAEGNFFNSFCVVEGERTLK